MAPAFHGVLSLSTAPIAIGTERKRLGVVGLCMAVGLTAFGGVPCDVVCNNLPTAFRDGRHYAI